MREKFATKRVAQPTGNWRISRRTMLRGMGAALALPFLEAMTPARAAMAAVRPPTRTAFIYFPNGVWRDAWIPNETGADYTLPYCLEPLEAFKSEFSVLSGLDKAASRRGDGHYAKTANFLTGEPVKKTTGKDISAGGVALDQLIASKIGDRTPLPSLETGIDPVISGIDSNVGYTRLYGSYISWRSATLPVAREINPRFVYERLFGGGVGATEQRRKDFDSILDVAWDDAKHLRGRLGRDDQVKLDEYLESVRAVEKRIEFSLDGDNRTWRPEPLTNLPEAPEHERPSDVRDHIDLMLDLMVLAFQTDSTRVQTFMFANDVSGRNCSFLDGVSGGHHDISHHEDKAEKIEQYKKITRWHTQKFARFLTKLQSIKEGDGNLLDNSMIMFGSSMSDGNDHDPNNLPILLAGRGGGVLDPGQHIANEKNTPLCNLYATMLQALDLGEQEFGDSNGTIDGVLRG